MSVILKLYGCATHPEDNTATNIGGAIDTSKVILQNRLTTNSYLEVLSNNAGDTGGNPVRSVLLEGVTSDGALGFDVVAALNGTTPVSAANNWGKLYKLTLGGSILGTITVRKAGNAGDIIQMPLGEVEARILHLGAKSAVAVGKSYYDKFFVKNIGDQTANNVTLTETADAPGIITFAKGVVGGTETNGGGNNWEVPFSGKTYANTTLNLGSLAPGEAIEVFSKISLTAGMSVQHFDWQITVDYVTA